MSAPTYILTNNSITFFFPGKNYTVRNDDPKYPNVIQSIKDNKDEAFIIKLLDVAIGVKKHISGLFDVDNAGNVILKGVKVPTMLANRILDCVKTGLPVYPLLKLWDNIMANPDKRAKTDLYSYLDHNQHPITPDGCFIAYRSVKPVRDDNGNIIKLTDFHTGTFDNSVGTVVTMDRSKCDSNPEQTCSSGLHAASWEYVSSFGDGDRVIVNVKVNPKFVTAIPVSYSERKLRCCKFEVLSINEDFKPNTNPIYDDGSLQSDADVFDNDDLDDEYYVDTTQNWKHQTRDSKGRFIKV